MHSHFIDAISKISSTDWNAITGVDYPFTRYEFLSALEKSGAVSRENGWEPHHLLLYDQEELIAVMPLYLKYHSYGEYVFDWAWADAYQKHHLNYYPKLLRAIPFTPATGPRLCIKNNHIEENIYHHVYEALIKEAEKLNASSCHILFPETEVKNCFKQSGFLTRTGVQYHWFNHAFTSFDDFLGTFSSRKRKNLKKERMKVNQQAITLKIFEGDKVSTDIWERFYYFYQMTYAKRSGHGGYLNQRFFEYIAKTMPENIVLVLAYRDGEENTNAIAGALNFRDSTTLYGRYWGCVEEFDYLHFEACYYQGIEYCINNKLKRFDPGAQGEHKIQRGFVPISTWSNHWIKHPEFNRAIGDFLAEEKLEIKRYITKAAELLPFKTNDT